MRSNEPPRIMRAVLILATAAAVDFSALALYNENHKQSKQESTRMSKKSIEQIETGDTNIRERLMDAKGKSALAANAVRGAKTAEQMPGWTADPETGFLVSNRSESYPPPTNQF